jgi:Family of unknown function (DUF6334)
MGRQVGSRVASVTGLAKINMVTSQESTIQPRDPFAILCSSDERLRNVEGQFLVYDDALPMLVAIRLVFDRTVLLLVAKEDDSMDVISNASFANVRQHEVRGLLESAPWKSAAMRPLLWAWRMTNQQGYFDGLQLDFAETVESPVTRVQLLVVASEFKMQEIGSTPL